MNFEQLKNYMEIAYGTEAERELPNGRQLKLRNGAVINIYNKNSVPYVQGKNDAEVKRLIGQLTGEEINKKVFIVYGHNEKVRDELEKLLQLWGMEPVILDKMAAGGKTIIEKLEREMSEAGYGIVLATADDEGYRKGNPDEKKFRCRQNVVLELGMLMAKLGRDRISILLQHHEDLERPSDIDGLGYIPFEDELEPKAVKLLKEAVLRSVLQQCGR